MRYNNYHKHSHYSNISTPDSIIKPKDLAERTIELGHTSLTTTEHGYAGNVFEYYDLCQEYNLKFIFGIEYYYVNDRHEKDRSNTHLMVLAKNHQGMKEMQRILSESSKTGYYYKNRIDKELLFSLNPENVAVTSTCIISYVGKHDDYEDNFIKPLYQYFGENFYLEIHDNVHKMQVEYNKKILDLHNRYKIPLIHACDSHYIYPEQSKDRDDFLRGKGINYPEEDGFILDYPDSDTIFKRYEKQGVFTKEQVQSSLENTLIIDDFEDIILDKSTIKMPTLYPNLTHEQKVNKLKKILTESWQEDKKEIPKSRYQDHLKAIREETKIVEETQMEDYFLLNEKIIKLAKDKGGVLTRTGRGSAPSFYINKLLGFTEIDRVDSPIPLYPTRFMSKSRILETKSLPDIDFNTSDQQPFLEATQEILGRDNVYYMIAYGTMKESEAFRNLCRAKNISFDKMNEVGKNLDAYNDDPKWKDFIEESKKFIGVIDSASPHPCAFILLDKSVSDELGLMKLKSQGSKRETMCALIDSGTADKWKYLKNDYLVVTVWDIISETFKLIDKPIPSIRELMSNLNKKVWDLYQEGLVATLNQTGTASGKPQVMRYKPKSVAELSAWVAAIRPGFASMKDTFLDRQQFKYGIPEFDKLLENSGGFCLYQEDVMSTLMFSGFYEDKTYSILKDIAKKRGGIEKIKDDFIKGFIKKTGSKDNAEKVWKIIEDNSKYSFNSSHSLSVALDSLYGAYLKANYPLEYYSVILNTYQDNQEETNKIYHELDHFGIRVTSIEFGKSEAKYSPDYEDNNVVKGLKSIKFLNEKIAEELMILSKNQYDDFIDLLIDIEEQTSVNSRQMDILISLNFFPSFGLNKTLLNIYEKFKKRYKKTHKENTKEKRIAEIREYADTVEDESLSTYEQLMAEKNNLGYIQTTYPDQPKSYGIITVIDETNSPKLYIYQLSTGKETMIKVQRKKFYDYNGKSTLHVGDIIDIKKTRKKQKQRMIGHDDNGKPQFEPIENQYESWLESCKIIN